MLFRVLVLAALFGLNASGNAPAQEGPLTGEISAVPLQVDVRGNRAKFNEYRDLRGGVHGHIDLRYDGDGTYFNFRAEDMGYKDQKYELSGGKRGNFTVHFHYDEIPHHSPSGKRSSP